MVEDVAPKRRCKHEGCGTILRQTNAGEYCSVHEDEADELELQQAASSAEPPESGFYTVAEAVALLPYSDRTIREMLHDGRIEGSQVGPRSKWLIPRGNIDHFSENTRKGTDSASHTQLSHATEPDPLVLAAKMRHVDGLLALVSRWEDGLREVPATFLAFLATIQASPLERIRVYCPSEFFADIAAEQGGHVQRRYDAIRRLPLGLTYSPSDRNRPVTVYPVIEKDPLFDSLLSHLSSRQYQPIWQAWGDLKSGVQEKVNSIAVTIRDGVFPPWPFLGKADTDSPEWREISEWLRASPSNLQNLLQRIRLRGMMPGCCDLCPDQHVVLEDKDELAGPSESAG
jgi:excisionase family DNA binding protein